VPGTSHAPEERTLKTKHVLVVEDNQDILLLTSELLADLELDSSNLMISACSDGAEALEQIEKQKFDLIITDLRLPKFNGDELIRRMAAGKGLNRRTPVVLTSGYFTDFGDGRAALGDEHSEANIYLLPKPFKRHDLQDVVEQWLGNCPT
jgi:CheY-like chemotaxis protein